MLFSGSCEASHRESYQRKQNEGSLKQNGQNRGGDGGPKLGIAIEAATAATIAEATQAIIPLLPGIIGGVAEAAKGIASLIDGSK